MKFFNKPDRNTWQEICKRPTQSGAAIFPKVQPVLEKVKLDGDSALRHFTRLFDGVDLFNIVLGTEELQNIARGTPEVLVKAIDTAYSNIFTFHSKQLYHQEPMETMPGVSCWRKSVAIEKVGLYIPGGSAPLFSTVLMLGIPAQIVGCKEVVLCTPPNKDGSIHPAIAYAASKCGITAVVRVGGAQAIAAMAYGTESVPQVYKIFGPGNQYVTAAKQLVSIEGVAIDMPAGPSEVLVVADHTSTPEFVAADLLSQAEHGPDSQVVLVCTDLDMLGKVQAEVVRKTKVLSRSAIAEAALSNSVAVYLPEPHDAIDFSNLYAPEHLILASDQASWYAERVVNAGSVFLGHYTPESAGDYASGTNHTLPTNGHARAYSGVSVDSFIKKITFQHITKHGIVQLSPTIEAMAEAEMLTAHAYAAKVRVL